MEKRDGDMALLIPAPEPVLLLSPFAGKFTYLGGESK